MRTFIGYIIRFDPKMYMDKNALRKKLGYENDPLIICSIGGTSIGKNLLDEDYSYPEYIRQSSEEVPGGPESSFFVTLSYNFQ